MLPFSLFLLSNQSISRLLYLSSLFCLTLSLFLGVLSFYILSSLYHLPRYIYLNTTTLFATKIQPLTLLTLILFKI
jgi:hypothetical protein